MYRHRLAFPPQKLLSYAFPDWRGQLGESSSFNFAALEAQFQAASWSGGYNAERYRSYIPTLPFSGGTIPATEFEADFAGGRRVFRNFLEPFDTNNDPELAKTVASLVTGDTLAADEISIGDMGANWGAAVVGMFVCLKWAGAATLNVGGITVQRQGIYEISSVNGQFVRLRIPGQTRTTPGTSTVPITSGAVLTQSFRPFNSRITNWRTSIQRAIDAGLWAVVTMWGGNLWDRATTQAGLAPFNDFGWTAIDNLHRSWCEWMVANITDPNNRLVLEWQNEDIALGFPDYAAMEALSKPHRERMLLIMREAAPTKLIVAGGAYYGFPLSLQEIVPQNIPGLIYKFHDYSDNDPDIYLAPVLSWRAANGNRLAWNGESDKNTYSDANGLPRRDHNRTRRDWMRTNLGVAPIYWGKRYAPYNSNSTTRELGTDAGNVFTPLSNMVEFLDERPLNQVAPTVTGVAQEDQVLQGNVGIWTGRAPITYTFQWQRGTTPIAGATSANYTAQAADVGQTLRLVISAVNSLGSLTVNSADTAVVAAPNTAPQNTDLPIITGVPQQGEMLSATAGAWSGTEPITYSFQWQRNGASISGATSSTYTAGASDVGSVLSVVVTAQNSAGQASATSLNTAVITVAPSGLDALLLNDAGDYLLLNNSGDKLLLVSSIAPPAPNLNALLINDSGDYLLLNGSGDKLLLSDSALVGTTSISWTLALAAF